MTDREPDPIMGYRMHRIDDEGYGETEFMTTDDFADFQMKPEEVATPLIRVQLHGGPVVAWYVQRAGDSAYVDYITDDWGLVQIMLLEGARVTSLQVKP